MKHVLDRLRDVAKRALPLLAVCALAAPMPAPAAAQDDDPRLSRLFRAMADDWAAGDAGAIARASAPGGVSIDLSSGPMGPIQERQLAAVLRRMFDSVETVRVSANLLEVVGGSPRRAFGSITWSSRVRGTQVPVRATVYFAMAMAGDEWRLTEIRVMR